MHSKRIIFLLILGLNTLFSIGQQVINDPSSQFGIGRLTNDFNIRSQSMAGLSLVLVSNRSEVNTSSAASLSRLSLTHFSVTGVYTAGFFGSAGGVQVDHKMRLGGATIAFPIINKKWGMAVSIQPVSLVGYNYTKSFSYDTIGSVEHKFLGSGGVNKASVSNGVVFQFSDNHFVSLGASINYFFGSINRSETVNYIDDVFFDTEYNIVNTYSSFNADFSMIYTKVLSINEEKRGAKIALLGMKFTPLNGINPKVSRLLKTKKGNVTRDTAVYIKNQLINEQLPIKMSFGIGYSNVNRFTVGLEYKIESNASYAKIYQSNDINVTYPTRNTVILGAEFNASRGIADNSYIKRKYRVGLRYSSPDVLNDGIGYNELGVTTGMYLPLLNKAYVVNGINFGMEYVLQLTNRPSNEFFTKSFLMVNVGFNLNSKWFIRPKYN